MVNYAPFIRLGLYVDISIAGEHQKLNASLALQLCRQWLIEKDQWTDKNSYAQGVSRFTDGLPIPFKDGLNNIDFTSSK